MEKETCHICRNEYEGYGGEEGCLTDEAGQITIQRFDLSETVDKRLTSEPWVCCVCYHIMFNIACDMKDEYDDGEGEEEGVDT